MDFGETVVTQAMDGESVEVQFGDFGRTVIVQLPTADGQWSCRSCDAGSDLPAPQVSQTPEGLQAFVFVLDPDKHAGVDYLMAFEATSPVQQPLYFSFTLAVAEAQARSEAFLQRACRLLDDSATDADALALLAAFIPDPALRDQAIQACNEIAQSGRTPPPGCSGVKPPDRGPFGKKIALTFDDGPLPGSTDLVLDTLKDKDVKATFFINGKAARSERARQLLQRIVAEEHIVANHTQSHCDSSKQSAGSFGAAQVASTDAVLQQAYAAAGKPVPAIKFFRFPYGATNCDINNVVQADGYQIIGWHIDTADWCFNSSKGGYGYCSPSTFKWVPDGHRGDYVGYTLSQARKHGGGILLMHDVHKFTRQQLGGLIDALKADGFEFVRLDDAAAFPKINDGIGVGEGSTYTPPAPSSPFTGDACGNKVGSSKNNGIDPQGATWQDYSAYQCVDKYHDGFAATGCSGQLRAGYCPGAANILCCVK